MEKKTFSQKLKTKKLNKALEDAINLKKDGTGSFSSGIPVFNILNANVTYCY